MGHFPFYKVFLLCYLLPALCLPCWPRYWMDSPSPLMWYYQGYLHGMLGEQGLRGAEVVRAVAA